MTDQRSKRPAAKTGGPKVNHSTNHHLFADAHPPSPLRVCSQDIKRIISSLPLLDGVLFLRSAFRAKASLTQQDVAALIARIFEMQFADPQAHAGYAAATTTSKNRNNKKKNQPSERKTAEDPTVLHNCDWCIA